MNPEHVEKVKRISAAFGEIVNVKEGVEAWIDRGMMPPSECDALWKKEFPPRTRLDLSDADLSGCFLAAFKVPRLAHADFRRARLDRTTWWGVNIEDSDFTGATLQDSTMIRVTCSRALFSGADLSGARLIAPLAPSAAEPADFTDANLVGASICIGAVSIAAGIRVGIPFKAILKGAKLTGCRVTGAAAARDELRSFLLSLSMEQPAAAIVVSEPGQEPAGGAGASAGSGGKCFLATAACGSPQAGDVVALREFREAVLRPAALGRAFIHAYEAVSPPLARVVARSPVLRAIVRRLVVAPSAAVARRWLRASGDRRDA